MPSKAETDAGGYPIARKAADKAKEATRQLSGGKRKGSRMMKAERKPDFSCCRFFSQRTVPRFRDNLLQVFQDSRFRVESQKTGNLIFFLPYETIIFRQNGISYLCQFCGIELYGGKSVAGANGSCSRYRLAFEPESSFQHCKRNPFLRCGRSRRRRARGR